MAGFNSYDAIINAMTVSGDGQEAYFAKTAPVAMAANQYYSGWSFSGSPAVGAWAGSTSPGNSTTNLYPGYCDSSTSGSIPLVSPTTASAKSLFIVSANQTQNSTVAMGGTMILVDRLADTGVITTTTGNSATINAGNLPLTVFGASVAGWPRYSNGLGVQLFLESLNTLTTVAGGFIVTYTSATTTDVVGTGSRVTTSCSTAVSNTRSWGGTGTTSPFLQLQGSDKGVQSVQSIAVTTAATAPNIALVACKPLLMLPCINIGYTVERDCVMQTPKLPKLEVYTDKSACLQWLFFSNAASTPTVFGTVTMVAG